MRTRVKNVQVIDGALNCSYEVFSASDADFKALFPSHGQDVEFIEDFWKRVGNRKAKAITQRLFAKRVNKKRIRGIHGTLFYQLTFKKKYYPTKKESEMTTSFKPVGQQNAVRRKRTRRVARSARD